MSNGNVGSTGSEQQDRIIERLQQFQDVVIETNQRIMQHLNEQFEMATKAAESASTPVTDLLPDELSTRLNAIELPSIPESFDPKTASDAYFDFVERVTETNRDFTNRLIKAWTPGADAASGSTTASGAESTTASEAENATPKSTAAKKAAPKKAAPKKAAQKKAAQKKAAPKNASQEKAAPKKTEADS